MCSSSTPKHLEELIAGYVLGNLCPEEAEEFRQLLDETPELITEVHQLQEVLELLPYALPTVVPPDHLRSTIIEAAYLPAQPQAKKQPALLWQKVSVSIAAVLAIALGLDNYRLQQELKSSKYIVSTLQNPETHLFSMQGKGVTAAGSILMDFKEHKAVIALQNLPPIAANQSYWLWAVVDGENIRCGQFNFNKSSTVFDKISIPSDSYKDDAVISSLFITLETSAAPIRPVGQVVLISHS